MDKIADILFILIYMTFQLVFNSMNLLNGLN